MKFVLNASVNWVKTPQLLRLWGYTYSGLCVLCNAPKCTLHHIISGCPIALASGRFTWWHDSVLAHIENSIRTHITSFKMPSKSVCAVPPLASCFVRKGKAVKAKRSPQRRRTDLNGDLDWKLLADKTDCQIVFPPEIIATPARPDIIIWSCSLRRVLLIELTCPAEEGIVPSQIFKTASYAPLINNVRSNTNWSVELMTIEVGARGFVSRSVPRCLKRLGLPPSSIACVQEPLLHLCALLVHNLPRIQNP